MVGRCSMLFVLERLARSHEGPLRLAELAAAAGYFDQQHLAHEVRVIVGTTPSRLLLSC
jgi:AraC-like DNA-binding protein